MSQFSKNVTFQTFPYPPPPPPLQSDQEFLKEFESKIITPKPRKKINKNNLCSLRLDLLNLISALRNMKSQEEMLGKNSVLSDEEWRSAMESIENNKAVVQRSFMRMSGLFIEAKKKFFNRRAAKRRRLHRLAEEYQDWRDIYCDKKSEMSLKIDENLHKMNEKIQRAKREEVAKREADMVLKDVLRKKQDAKKSIAKLEALLKLKQVRLNTAKGKGQSVSENDSAAFKTYIENLKSLWVCKLSKYDKEESKIRKHLERWKESYTADLVSSDQMIKNILAEWQRAMFGTEAFPQVDFKGDIEEFIRVRSEWDRYIDDGPDSTPLPIGWVLFSRKE